MFRAIAMRSNIPRMVVLQSRAASSKTASPAIVTQSSMMTGLVRGWYNVFGQSNHAYVSWLIMLIVVGEIATGKATDTLWETSNQGHTFASTDWAKFDAFEEDEEEEEESGEEEEEEDNDDEEGDDDDE